MELFPGRPGGSSSGAKKSPRSGDLSDATPILLTKWATLLNINDLEMGSRLKPLGYSYPRIDVFPRASQLDP